jgi:vancomycin permeability regulator SanA
MNAGFSFLGSVQRQIEVFGRQKVDVAQGQFHALIRL